MQLVVPIVIVQVPLQIIVVELLVPPMDSMVLQLLIIPIVEVQLVLIAAVSMESMPHREVIVQDVSIVILLGRLTLLEVASMELDMSLNVQVHLNVIHRVT